MAFEKSQKLTVLIVDDESRWIELVCDIATHLGYSVAVATSGNKAIEMIRQSNAYDRVITDTQMADGDGLDVLEFLYKKYGAASRAVTYIHSADGVYKTPDGRIVDLAREVEEKIPGTTFKQKSVDTFDNITKFLKK